MSVKKTAKYRGLFFTFSRRSGHSARRVSPLCPAFFCGFLAEITSCGITSCVHFASISGVLAGFQVKMRILSPVSIFGCFFGARGLNRWYTHLPPPALIPPDNFREIPTIVFVKPAQKRIITQPFSYLLGVVASRTKT